MGAKCNYSGLTGNGSKTWWLGHISGDNTDLRRIDDLSDRVFFGGLEPAPDGDGCMVFVGPPGQ